MSKLSRLMRRIGIYLAATLLTLFSIIPIFWMIQTSLRIEVDAVRVPIVWIPSTLTLLHYFKISDRGDAIAAYGNTIIIAVFTAMIAVTLAEFGAYALARTVFRGRLKISLIVLATQMIPPMSILIPLFVLMRALGLLGSYLALIITYTAVQLPFLIWIFMGFMEKIPKEMEEASALDGAGYIQLMTKIIIPLSVPGLIAGALFSVVWSFWDFSYALILTNINTRTIGVWIGQLYGRGYVEYTQIMAYGTFVMLPLIILIVLASRHIVRGVSGGVLKG